MSSVLLEQPLVVGEDAMARMGYGYRKASRKQKTQPAFPHVPFRSSHAADRGQPEVGASYIKALNGSAPSAYERAAAGDVGSKGACRASTYSRLLVIDK